MTKPTTDGYRAKRILLDNSALIRDAEKCLKELKQERLSMTAYVLIADIRRTLAEIHRNELVIMTGSYEED